MTIVVAYTPRPDGQAALEQGIEAATQRREDLIVVNASPRGGQGDPSAAAADDLERVKRRLEDAGIVFELRQFVRGKSAAEEVELVVESCNASLLVLGLRKRSALGKLILGSVAQQLLLSVRCPILVVKAG